MKKLNQEGFSVIEVLLALIAILIIVFIGFYVAHNRKASSGKPAANVSTNHSSSYAGWKSYSSSAEGLTLRYPSSWKVNDSEVQTACDGSVVGLSVQAPASEIAPAIKAAMYSIVISRIANNGSATCAQTEQDYSSLKFDSITSADRLTDNSYLTFFNNVHPDSFSADFTGFYGNDSIDSALVTDNQYNGEASFTTPQTTLMDGTTYQIGIHTNTTDSYQVSNPSTIDLGTFKSSRLYKDTINILNSIKTS